MFTVFLRGRGGKGVATSLGVSLGLSPAAGLRASASTRWRTRPPGCRPLGSLLGVWAFPLIAAVAGSVPREYVALSVVVAALVTLRHRANIRRLLRREETRA